MYIALMLANYFHDLAVAMLAASVIVIHLAGRIMGEKTEAREILNRLVQGMSRVAWWSLGYVIVAGAVRAWFFMDFEWNPLVEKQGMLVALGFKHVLLVGLTVFGIVGMRRTREKYRDHEK